MEATPETTLSQVPMSVVYRDGRIAFAAFNEETNLLILDEFVAHDTDAFQIAEKVVAVIDPSILLVSSKIVADELLMESLRTTPYRESSAGNDEATNAINNAARSTPYRIMKTSDYDLRKCKSMIMKLRVGSLSQRQGVPQQLSRNSTFCVSSYHALASLINFDSCLQIQAVGSLMSFLELSNYQIDHAGNIFVDDIVPTNLGMYMNISQDALSALQIFATEHHPLVASKGSGNAKEGFSLFSLLDRTRSPSGRRKLRDWMQKPLVDVDSIQSRQDGVELFMLASIQEAAVSICGLLDSVGSVDQILVRLRKCIVRPKDYVVLLNSLSSAVAIFDILQNDVLWKLKQLVDSSLSGTDTENPKRCLVFLEELLQHSRPQELQGLLEMVSDVIDEAQMKAEKCTRVEIRAGFSEQLDYCRAVYDGLNGM